MYAVGTPILYSRMGVCQVESIGAPPFQKSNERRYYKLRSLFSASGERIYVPVDASASLRPLINSGEASDYLQGLSRLQPDLFRSRRPAEIAAHYQKVLAACEPENCLLLLKEIYLKERELSVRSKRLGQVDIQYQRIVERLVCEEFAVALHTTPDLMKNRLYAAMEIKQ